jgi:hypothetical protein
VRLTKPVTTAAVLFLLACDAAPAVVSPSGDLKPQLDLVDNGGCPPTFRPVGWGVGEDPDRYEDGIVCRWQGAKHEHSPPQTPPPIDNNIPPTLP